MQVRDHRVWRAVFWVLGLLALVIAFLGPAQLGENLTRVIKAWRPLLF